MKNDFKSSATALNWGWIYGRQDFNNLADDLEAGKTYLVMDPIKTKPLYNNMGATYGHRYSGYFMLLRKSDLDQTYDEKATAYIEPLEADIETLKNRLTGCNGDYSIDWEYTEIVNVFSENMDGYTVRYNIELI